MPLRGRRCHPREGGVRPLTEVEIRPLATEVPGWSVAGKPDVAIHYREVELTLWTHAIGRLSENDFILAAKIDELET